MDAIYELQSHLGFSKLQGNKVTSVGFSNCIVLQRDDKTVKIPYTMYDKARFNLLAAEL